MSLGPPNLAIRRFAYGVKWRPCILLLTKAPDSVSDQCTNKISHSTVNRSQLCLHCNRKPYISLHYLLAAVSLMLELFVLLVDTETDSRRLLSFLSICHLPNAFQTLPDLPSASPLSPLALPLCEPFKANGLVNSRTNNLLATIKRTFLIEWLLLEFILSRSARD